MSHFMVLPTVICVSVYALYERKNRDITEDKVSLCRRLDRPLRKSCKCHSAPRIRGREQTRAGLMFARTIAVTTLGILGTHHAAIHLRV